MNAIAGGADYNGDGRADLIAIDDTTGYLWIYPGNGAGGWGTRIGPNAGWASMNAIAGGADYNGTSLPDLIAIDDATGYLWIYPGNGAGGWGTRIGPDHGWASMNAIQ
jgi:FG-GAP-like repeat